MKKILEQKNCKQLSCAHDLDTLLNIFMNYIELRMKFVVHT